MGNLKALVYGVNLNYYQRSLARDEFEKLIQSKTEANVFILEIARLLDIDTDGIGYDDIQLSIDDFEEAIKRLM